MALAKPIAANIRQARRRFASSGPNKGTVWLASGPRFGTRQDESGKRTRDFRARKGFSAAFEAKTDFQWNFDAGLLVEHLSASLIAYYSSTVRAGLKPDGMTAQPPLKSQARAQRAFDRGFRKSMFRGYRTGEFAANIRRTAITGSTVRASTRILAPTNRNVFIAQEAKHRIQYFGVLGKAAEVIKEATDQFVAGGLANQNREDVFRGELSASDLSTLQGQLTFGALANTLKRKTRRPRAA